MEIARQYEVDKNIAQAELRRLNRRLDDITNDTVTASDDNNSSSHRSKRRRTQRHKSPQDLEDEDNTLADTCNHAGDEHFVYQAGHKFFLVYAPWIHSGEDLFDIKVDEEYDAAERFENDKTKSQGQLYEILDLLQGKFQQQALHQRWLRRQVSSIIFHGTLLTFN